MKNVLIICGSFPPQSYVGGLRPSMFAKYLNEFGWNPFIITRDLTTKDPRYDNKMPIELPAHLVKQILRVKYSLDDEQLYLKSRNLIHLIRDFFYPEYSSPPGLYFKMKKASCKVLKNNKFDLVFSTSPDQWELTLGSYLSRKCKIPLIADFRDIFEQEEGLKRSIRQYIQAFRFAVRRYITSRQVAHCTTVSEFHKSTLQRKLGRNCSIVYNGYEDLYFQPISSSENSKRPFRIIYIGRVLDIWYQNPEILFKSIDELIEEKVFDLSEISVEFYGTDKEKLKSILDTLSDPGFIKFNQRISYIDVPRKLNDAQMLLLLTNKGRNGILTTKFFEYAGTKKPILCVPGDQNELDGLIKKYDLGYSISNMMVLKEKLIEWNISFKSGLFPSHISSNVEFFTRRNQTKRLAEVFNKVLIPKIS